MHVTPAFAYIRVNLRYVHRLFTHARDMRVQEENFGEAISNAHKLFSPPSIRALPTSRFPS